MFRTQAIAALIELAHADPAIETTVLTTEEEGIALSAGAWLGGQRAVLLMQSSGVGNCINMLSLIATCRFPLLALVTMRGEWGEFNPWQVPMGQATPEALAIMGVQVHRVDTSEEAAPTVAAAAAMAFDGDQAVAVLLSQRLLGTQDLGRGRREMSRATHVGNLDRRAAVRALLAARGEALVVTGLGSPTYDVFAAGDHDANMYLWGAMGGAAMIGLGLALAQKRRPVVVVTGDGEQLMGMGALATIAVKQPGNLSLVVLDNGHYGETGQQASHTGLGVDLHRIAAAAGFAAVELTDLAGIERPTGRSSPGSKARRASPRSGSRPRRPVRALPARDGVHLKNRFRAHLGLPVN